jgi:hypothetical protein
MELMQTHKNTTKPFYKSVKKMLGIFSTIFYWGIQFYVVSKDPTIVVSFIIPDVALITTLLALKKLDLSKKEEVDEKC